MKSYWKTTCLVLFLPMLVLVLTQCASVPAPVGFKPGYRVSWTCATGAVTEEVFEDNEKSWSGDHCLNPPDVPGILFCNRKIDADQVSIMDIGPTVLDLFGVPVPDYCDGQPLKVQVP